MPAQFESVVLFGVAAGSAVAVACSSGQDAVAIHAPNCHDDGYCPDSGFGASSSAPAR